MRPHTLVRDHVSRDTVEALEQMLAKASSGQIIGIAFVAMLKRRRYLVNVAGEAFRDPTYARGAVCALDDELKGLVNGSTGPEAQV